MIDSTMSRPYLIGIESCVGPFQGAGQSSKIIEVEWRSGKSLAELIWTLGVSGQRRDLGTGFQQSPGYVLPCVSECACNDMCADHE